MPRRIIWKNFTLTAVALTGAILMVWGVGGLSGSDGIIAPENGMGGPVEPPLSSVVSDPTTSPLLGLCSSSLGCSLLPVEQKGPVYRPEDQPVEMVIAPGQTFYEALAAHKVAHEDIMALVQACQGFRNLKKVRAGEVFQIIVTNDGGLESLAFDLDEESFVTFVRKGDIYERIDGAYPVEHRLKAIGGTIQNSLYASLQKLDAPLALAPKMNDILGWDLDFNRDLRQGDTFRILYEEVFKEGKRIRTGNILGVEIVNRGKAHQAFQFTTPDQRTHYYDAEGRNLQKQLLRAPLNYSRISSKFSYRRFHPVLKRYMPHLGVDYAAPLGTPVKAGGDGVIVACTSKKGNGRYIQIRHTNAEYETYYLHLSRYAKGMKVGRKVTQGDVIGYVGATGYATGPHLDYRVKRNGKFVNPRSLKLPAAQPVAQEQMADFQGQARIYQGLLADLEMDGAPVELPPVNVAGIGQWQGPVMTAGPLPEGIRAVN
ncbi:peptidase M23 [bacterium DOLJORAL78_65_58]|nr:MAG: peptidase M23 [bacterium DOLZORAL124_64_63]PIE76364.1 MAG: peptidase M23 [bacterium DOLJORAL78_65_58]